MMKRDDDGDDDGDDDDDGEMTMMMLMMMIMLMMVMMVMMMTLTPQEGEQLHDQGQLLDLEKPHLHEPSQPGGTRNHHQPLQGALKRQGCC